MRPKVSIIILNWNGWKDTIECLESVFRNNYPSYQVIVVDNGSTDGSIEKIKAWPNGKQEVLTPEPSHPFYHLSHPPVKKPIPYVYYAREEAERGGNLKLEEKVTKKWQEQKKSNSKELNPTSAYLLIAKDWRKWYHNNNLLRRIYLKCGQKKNEIIVNHRFGISGCKNESFGIAVAEMVKAGCIVFVPNGGGQAEIVDHPKLIYENIEDGVQKIKDVLKNEKLQNNLREHLSLVSQKFSVENFQKSIKEIVSNFLKGKIWPK